MAEILMSNFKITFNKNFIHKSKRGSITAPLFFDYGEYQFPENGWSDFVVVVLSWWIDACSVINKGREEKVELSFMDGPMLLRLFLREEGKVEMHCVDQRGEKEIIEYKTTIDLSKLSQQLISVANEVLNICSQNGWESEDISNLRKEVCVAKTIIGLWD